MTPRRDRQPHPGDESPPVDAVTSPCVPICPKRPSQYAPQQFTLHVKLCCCSCAEVELRLPLNASLKLVVRVLEHLTGGAPDSEAPDHLVAAGKKFEALDRSCIDCGLTDNQKMFLVGSTRVPPQPLPKVVAVDETFFQTRPDKVHEQQNPAAMDDSYCSSSKAEKDTDGSRQTSSSADFEFFDLDENLQSIEQKRQVVERIHTERLQKYGNASMGTTSTLLPKSDSSESDSLHHASEEAERARLADEKAQQKRIAEKDTDESSQTSSSDDFEFFDLDENLQSIEQKYGKASMGPTSALQPKSDSSESDSLHHASEEAERARLAEEKAQQKRIAETESPWLDTASVGLTCSKWPTHDQFNSSQAKCGRIKVVFNHSGRLGLSFWKEIVPLRVSAVTGQAEKCGIEKGMRLNRIQGEDVKDSFDDVIAHLSAHVLRSRPLELEFDHDLTV